MSITLYPGIAFSPQAELTDNIGAADTIIPVSDAAAFPEAPNLATIGTDEEGETILYTAKTANALSGCRRGVEGTAKSWQAGEPIGRNFTAKDHADLIAEVREAAKTAEAGGVTFDDGETFQEKYDSGELVGPVGKTGAPGKDGPQGPTGKTAYQYAVDGGYTGTEAQFQALLNDIPNKQPKLRGSAGQVVGFGADGAARAVAGWSNPNLLDNWYFADPVNQRGQEEYTATGYTIDRWRIAQGMKAAVRITDSGLEIKRTSDTRAIFQQVLTIDDREFVQSFAGREVTLSALFGQELRSVTMTIPTSNDENWYPAGTSGSKVNSMYVRLSINSNTTTGYFDLNFDIYVSAGGAGGGPITAVKLELGSQQTLAHQDAAGNWVLNDPPPDKALELLKCQRYLCPLSFFLRVRAVRVQASVFTFVVPTPAPLRAMPTLVDASNIIRVYNISGTQQTGFRFGVAGVAPLNIGVIITATKTAHGLSDGYLEFASNIEKAFLTSEL